MAEFIELAMMDASTSTNIVLDKEIATAIFAASPDPEQIDVPQREAMQNASQLLLDTASATKEQLTVPDDLALIALARTLLNGVGARRGVQAQIDFQPIVEG